MQGDKIVRVRWTDRLGYIALRSLICLIQSVSLERADRLCHILGKLLANWTTLRRETTDANIALVFGDIPPLRHAVLRERMWHNLLLMVCEIVHAPRKIRRTNWRDFFYMPNKSDIVEAIADPRATVLVSGHYGNFELAGYFTGLAGFGSTTIARPLDNPLADRYLHEFRSRGGQRILPKEGSSKAIADLLASGGILALLADQHAGPKGCWVDFFGHPASSHKALALFVLSSKAPMVVCYNRRLDRPLRFEMGVTGVADPADLDYAQAPAHMQSVEKLTVWYNQRLEEAIRLSPEQYWWLHRRWREPPATVLRRRGASKARQGSAAA